MAAKTRALLITSPCDALQVRCRACDGSWRPPSARERRTIGRARRHLRQDTRIADAPADAETRGAWLERLYEAHRDDHVPYIERLADDWGALCASDEVASAWADRLIDTTRRALSPDPNLRGHFHGTPMCLSALFRAGRYAEIVELVSGDRVIWNYKQWAVKALAAQGKKAEALRYAEGCRSPWASEIEIDRLCEDILLSSGIIEEAYARYGLRANQAGTYLAVAKVLGRELGL